MSSALPCRVAVICITVAVVLVTGAATNGTEEVQTTTSKQIADTAEVSELTAAAPQRDNSNDTLVAEPTIVSWIAATGRSTACSVKPEVTALVLTPEQFRVNVTWTIDDQCYKLSWSRISWMQSGGRQYTWDLEKNVRDLTLNHLTPCKETTVSITPISDQLLSENGITETTETLDIYPNLNRIYLSAWPSSTDMTVYWSLKNLCDFPSEFEVVWSYHDGNEGGSHNANNTESKYIIRDLPPCTKLDVTVKLRVNDTVVDEMSDSEDTTEEIPSVIIDEIKTSMNTLNVYWSHADPCDLLQGFFIHWENTDGSIVDSDNLQNDYNYYSIEDLPTCTDFLVILSPIIRGEPYHEYRDEMNATTRHDEPPHVPYAGTTNDGEVITVTWSEPETDCPISSYEVDWTGDILWSNDWDNGQFIGDSNVTEYVLSDTTPYTTYTICVAAKDSIGQTGKTQCSVQKTDQQAPGKPRDPKCVESTSSSITISWTRPLEVNGVIEYYDIALDSTVGGTSVIHTVQPDEENYQATIQNLDSDILYSMQIKGFTVELGPAEYVGCSTFPRENSDGNLTIILASVFASLFVVSIILFVVYIKRDAIFRRSSNGEPRKEVQT